MSSASEYLRDLVRADQKRHAKAQLEQVLLSAMGSGDGGELTEEMVGEMIEKRGTGARAGFGAIAELAGERKMASSERWDRNRRSHLFFAAWAPYSRS